MWMNDVAAAWMMTSLTTSPVMVALVQTASTLPVLMLGLPSGALADILNRRRYLMFTQFWVAARRAADLRDRAQRHDERAHAALAHLRQRHRPGDAHAGLRRHRAGARAAQPAAAGDRAQRRGDERVAHHRPDHRRRADRQRRQRLRVRAERGAVGGGRHRHPALAAPARADRAARRALPRRDPRRRAVRAPVLAHAHRAAARGAVLPAVDRAARAAAAGRARPARAARSRSRCCSPAWAWARSPRRSCCRACATVSSSTAWCATARCCRPRRRWRSPSRPTSRSPRRR